MKDESFRNVCIRLKCHRYKKIFYEGEWDQWQYSVNLPKDVLIVITSYLWFITDYCNACTAIFNHLPWIVIIYRSFVSYDFLTCCHKYLRARYEYLQFSSFYISPHIIDLQVVGTRKVYMYIRKVLMTKRKVLMTKRKVLIIIHSSTWGHCHTTWMKW